MNTPPKARLLFIFLLLIQSLALAAPNSPIQLSPSKNDPISSGVPFVFRWNASDGADMYDLRIYDRVNRVTVLREANLDAKNVCSGSICEFTLPANIQVPVGINHLWQIAAKDSNGTSARSSINFDILSDQLPPIPPTQIYPTTDTKINTDQVVTYIWNVASNVSTYDFRLYNRVTKSTHYRNSNIDAEDFCDQSLCEYTPNLTSNLPVAANHLWQVSASNATGTSQRSTTTFPVVSVTSPPTPPTQLIPHINQNFRFGERINFVWQSSTNTTTYDIRIYDRVRKSTIYRNRQIEAAEACEGTQCSYSPDIGFAIEVGRNHLWQLSAANSAGSSDRSTISFNVTANRLDEFELVFEDNFDTGSLNSEKWDTALLWGPYLPINNEQQLYVDSLGMHESFDFSPFTFTDNSIKISAHAVNENLVTPLRPPEDSPLWQPNDYSEYRYNGPTTDPVTGEVDPGYLASDTDYLSGIMTTYDAFKISHGYIETRMKLPEGRGLWPAFWMLPTHYVEDVPEIDIIEYLGHDKETVYNTYHYFDIADNWRKISTPSFEVKNNDWTNDFHVFGVEWSPKKITWYVDGEISHEVSSDDYKISNQSMYLIANLAVGGDWAGPPDETTNFPATLEIDYVRAYKRKKSVELDLENDYQLVFNDEFSLPYLDSEKWNTHYLWGPFLPINNEEQYYVDSLGIDSSAGEQSPFKFENGRLSITAKEANDTNSYPIPQSIPPLNSPIWNAFPEFQRNQNYQPQTYTSGVITSYDSFKFVHGYAEIRAKIPEGAGLWPAFWLLNGYYVGAQPEIDIMEARGENPHQLVHSYHRLVNGVTESESILTDSGNVNQKYSDDFHRYGVSWEPGKITWFVDGTEVQSYSNPDVSYQVMYLIANLAVGGNFLFEEVDASKLPAEFVIDYIRVYQDKGPQ